MFNCFPDADARAQARVGPGLATPLCMDERGIKSHAFQITEDQIWIVGEGCGVQVGEANI